METYTGVVTTMKTKGLWKEGSFKTAEGFTFRFRAKSLPSSKDPIIIQGNFTTENVFYVEKYYLTTKLLHFLPEHFVEEHKHTIQLLDKYLSDRGISEILEHPELLDQWLVDKKDIKDQITHYLNHGYALPNLINYLSQFSLSQKKIHEIHQKLGPQAVEILENHAYEICKIASIPFQVADQLAQNKGILPHSSERIWGAIQYVYSQYQNGGNSYLSLNELVNRVFQLTGKSISLERIQIEIERFASQEEHQMIRTQGGLFYYRPLYFTEIQIAQRLMDLTSVVGKVPKPYLQVMERLMQEGKIPILDEVQRKGVEQFFLHPVLLIQGEAGTGKTSWISYLLTILKEIIPNATIKLAALTGKASRRISEATGHPAQTIHSLLGKGINENSRVVYHYKKNPLNVDVLIIDEASMINEYLWRDILWSIERGTKLVFIGDPNQLEPIGPGRPFIDMIQYDFPTVTLQTNYRNDSGILTLARTILKGEVDDALLHQEGIHFISTETIEQAKEELVMQYRKNEGKYPIISMYREEFSLGTNQLNPFLKMRLNPTPSEIGMSENDPVIQTQNTKKAANGDLGIIRSYHPVAGARISFETTKEVDYTLDEMLGYLELAYAITTSKTQGSQYEGVIIVLVDIKKELSHRHSMWYRNSLYTAITRAKKELILVGDYNEFIEGVKRTGFIRKTRLIRRFEQYCPKS
jgi:exodeoxyribonuclease V alpha subunit